jgi:glycosyltransferase involved in cell wall biosynthesis
LAPEKGHVILLEAMRRLAAQGVEFRLVLAGDGEFRPEIEGLISRYGLAGSVRLTGWLTATQVRDEILAARALVLPSFAEGLPVVLMEAMALRRPVISTFVSGIPELVRPGQDGWLVPPGDATTLADAIRNCLEAPTDLIARMGESARERVLAEYDVNTEAAKLKELFYATERESRGSLIPATTSALSSQPAALASSGPADVLENSRT